MGHTCWSSSVREIVLLVQLVLFLVIVLLLLPLQQRMRSYTRACAYA